MKRKYIRKSVHDVEEILPLIRTALGESAYATFGNTRVGIGSRRLQTYAHDGVTCRHCGMVAEFFAIEQHAGEQGWHLNIYGFRGLNEVMMTSDHILPKSRGGSDLVVNRQCLCDTCNKKKGNKREEELHLDTHQILILCEA